MHPWLWVRTGSLFIFGGDDGNSRLNDLYQFILGIVSRLLVCLYALDRAQCVLSQGRQAAVARRAVQERYTPCSTA
jgi:hypothetical protein